MLSFFRAGLPRSIFLALGAGALFGFAGCGGKAEGIDPNDMDYDDPVGAAGFGNVGGSGAGARAGIGGTGGSRSGIGGGAQGGSFGAGATGGTGQAGSFGNGGSASTAGAAGSATMPDDSVCVNFDDGLAGLPMSAFPASDFLAATLCGGLYDDDHVYQAVCFPAPVGQSCAGLYPTELIGLLYSCGSQETASFVCGPQRPPTNTPGCVGNECCYVLGGECGGRLR